MRLFSAAQGYHYIFLFISIGMVGGFFGAQKSYLDEAQKNLPPSITKNIFYFSLSMLLFMLAFMIDLPFIVGIDLIVRIVCNLIANICAGYIVATLIRHSENKIHLIYGFDLMGASLACLLFIPLMRYLHPGNTLQILVFLNASLSAYFFFHYANKKIFKLSLVYIALLCVVPQNFVQFNLKTTPLKSYLPTFSKIEFRKWNEFSFIQVGESMKNFHHIWIDGDAETAIAPEPKNAEPSTQNASLAYQFKPIKHALIIGPGGGPDVVMARHFGVSNITAVELNPIIANDIMRSEPFLSYSNHLYQQPGINVVVDEGRSFVTKSHESFDAIQITMIDTWAATASGAFSLAENNLYTVEAFESYFKHLNPDGILILTRWKLPHPIEILKILALSKSAFKRLGIDNISQHIAVISKYTENTKLSVSTVIVKNTPFTASELHILNKKIIENNNIIDYLPGTTSSLYKTFLSHDDKKTFEYKFGNIDPVYDNSPFFFHRISLKNIIDNTYDRISVSNIIALIVFIFSLELIKTAYNMNANKQQERTLFAYFMLVGFSFMLIEFYFIQRLTLFLGHPTYSSTVSLFCILNSTAAGIFLSHKIATKNVLKVLKLSVVCFTALAIIYICNIIPLLNYTLITLPLSTRILISALCIFPWGFLMGFFMPLVLRDYCSNHARSTWAWCVNSAASVCGSVAAIFFGIYAGFDTTLLVAVLGYALAVLALSRTRASSEFI